MKSQNNEYEIVYNYFNKVANDNRFSEFSLLSIGENDGITLSNSYDLLNNKYQNMLWRGVLLEPSPTAFKKLKNLYNDVSFVKTYNYGISDVSSKQKFYDSGSHLGNDTSLLSSLIESETKKWVSTDFKIIEADFLTFQHFRELCDDKFNFISIDAEGYDYNILKQIDLKDVNCMCLCIEHNGDLSLVEKYKEYCDGMIEIGYNAENIILAL